MDSSIIIEMNRLLRQCHVDRIRMTPFMWCLNIQSPVEVNLKLLKVMVCRWVGHDNSFRVSQKLVAFRVIDVFMSIGLEIGGLEIPFDEVVVGLVGEMFKSKTISLNDLTDMFNVIVHDKNIDVDVVLLDDLDSLCLYDWCIGVHKHIVENLNKCKKKIMGAGIPQSVTLSGNVAVLQLNMEWYLRKEDRHRPEIRAAFNMDDGGMSEGSLGEGSKVEKDDDDDESFDDGTLEAGAKERLRKNNEDIRALNAKIGVLTRELFEICQTPIFHEADACGTDEEVGGGVDEAPGVGGEEKPEVGGDEEAEVRPDCGFEEEGDGNAVHDPLGAYTEVRGEDKTAHEEELVSRTVDNIHFIEIDDDGDEEEREVVPLVIPPLRSFVGDPSTTVDVDQLYTAVSVREMTVYRVVSEIIGQTLSTTSFYTLAPIKYVDNMVVLFACTIFMYFEKRLCGVVKRIHFSPLYSLFLPFVHDDHWRCYSVKLRSLEIFVIDSLGKGIRDRKRIDTAVAENMARFFCILMNTPEGSIGPLTVKQANIPSQPNLYDCGVIMLKAMEIWDGDEKYNGKSMPQYTTEELLGIRKKYVCDWILDNENIRRMEALQLYGIF
ncbi:uncharacterized protein LOC128194395 [Vigna angularis]|uniref:uncharacterized protein LOC128194395 n=1 Tax=Phaseolus angularis TaxID=3914 RepID=UPI0022B4E44C|nr:uncharacterized protein LOC128194395 [Vigna angularis]